MSNEVRGPKAPKDPTKKRPCFYIMRNKEISGAPQPDGRGVQFIYEDSGRLPVAAKISGSVTDEEILNLLTTTEGFRKLTYSLGVTIEADNKDEEINFAFQMYGKTEKYSSGTTINKMIKANGMEHVIIMDEITWSDDDDIPGQIRYEFDAPGKLAKASVCLYLNDGYDAPEQEKEEPVDFNSSFYTENIAKSLMNKGNNVRLKKAIDKARKGEDVTISFIGGSITQGAGAIPINTECYAYKTFEGFCKITGRTTNDNVHYCKAGVGGTPSELGMLRYESDVLSDGEPDVVVVEFAVNDEGDETKGVCYDSLVRKIYNGPGKPAVILLFAVFADDWNLQDRLSPVGFAYNLPMVSTRNSVEKQFYLKRGEGKVVSKSQFFYDVFHPTNIGHTIMADGIINLLNIVDQEEYDECEVDITPIEAPLGKTFENVKLLDRAHNEVGAIIEEGDFYDIDTETQGVERNLDLGQTKEFPNNYMFAGVKRFEAGEQITAVKPFTVKINAKALLFIMKDEGNSIFGTAEVFVDGKKAITANPLEVGWNHCSPLIILNETESKEHLVEVKMIEGHENKNFTILGIGYVE